MENLERFCKTAEERIKSFSKGPVVFFCKEFRNSPLSVEDRKEFRKILVQKIKAQSFYKEKRGKEKGIKKTEPIEKKFCLDKLLQTGSRPEHPLLSLSISHCKNRACFVFIPKEDSPSESFSIGLDIEETKRISKQTVSRISSLEEQNSSPSPALLWTAKEAGFKCFSQETLLLSECHISNWLLLDEPASKKLTSPSFLPSLSFPKLPSFLHLLKSLQESKQEITSDKEKSLLEKT